VVTLELTDAPPVIQADEQELHVALSKLVENAVQHTPRGGTVTLRTETRGEHAIVEVGDTGSGISEEDLPHVFERFYRGDKARTSRGAGLGLSIAQKIVEAHGGTVEVESVEGRGSTFKVRLPLAVGPSDR
jgi:signal transduction histidine kinase